MTKRIITFAGMLMMLILVQGSFSEESMEPSMQHGKGMEMRMDKSRCPHCGKMMDGMHKQKQDRKGSMDLEDHFFDVTKLLLSQQEEFKLTDKQRSDIMKLKMNLKKEFLRKNAEIEILKMDIGMGLMEDKVDAKSVKSQMKKVSSIKDEKSEALVDAIVSIKGMLTSDQMMKLKKNMME